MCGVCCQLLFLRICVVVLCWLLQLLLVQPFLFILIFILDVFDFHYWLMLMIFNKLSLLKNSSVWRKILRNGLTLLFQDAFNVTRINVLIKCAQRWYSHQSIGFKKGSLSMMALWTQCPFISWSNVEWLFSLVLKLNLKAAVFNVWFNVWFYRFSIHIFVSVLRFTQA